MSSGERDDVMAYEEWDDDADERPPLVYVSYERGMPPDAQRLGLDRNTEEGALLAMAGSLNARNPLHRLVAWALLAAFSLPLLLTLWNELF
jgi:hypothetical protein